MPISGRAIMIRSMPGDLFDALETLLRSRGPQAGFELLISKVREEKKYALVFEARLMQSLYALGLPRIILSFAPSWRRLPDDIKAHLIDHPAQPSNEDSQIPARISHLLPTFNGEQRSLALNRKPYPSSLFRTRRSQAGASECGKRFRQSGGGGGGGLLVAAVDCDVPLILSLGKPFFFPCFHYSRIPFQELLITVSYCVGLHRFQIGERDRYGIPSGEQGVAF